MANTIRDTERTAFDNGLKSFQKSKLKNEAFETCTRRLRRTCRDFAFAKFQVVSRSLRSNQINNKIDLFENGDGLT